jgi:ABC-type phosphate transport system auxiliary subunit
MARALLGHLSTTADRHLIEEVARLRGRVRELETELAELKAASESDQLLHELHRITTSESALA